MKKKFLIATIILSIIIIIIGVVIVLNNKNKIIQKKMDTIINDYSGLKTTIEEFSDVRFQVFDAVPEYLTETPDKYDSIISTMGELEKKVEQVNEKSVNLKDYCVGTSYKDKDVNLKCDAFIINYEQVMNYFVNDVEYVNGVIEKYNNTLEKGNQDKILSAFSTTKAYSYVDINSDGVYSGKE